MHTWSSIAFYLAVFVNFLVALFYPYKSNTIGWCHREGSGVWSGRWISRGI